MAIEFDLQGAVFEEFGRPGASDLVHLVEPCPIERVVRIAVGEVEAGLEGAEGDDGSGMGADRAAPSGCADRRPSAVDVASPSGERGVLPAADRLPVADAAAGFPAAQHRLRLLPGLPGASVWADTAYRSAKNEQRIAAAALVSRVHFRKPRGKPMPEPRARANAAALASALE